MRGEDSIAELCRREPRKIYSLLKVVKPGGSEEELQLMLKKDLVKFDIYKGPRAMSASTEPVRLPSVIPTPSSSGTGEQQPLSNAVFPGHARDRPTLPAGFLDDIWPS